MLEAGGPGSQLRRGPGRRDRRGHRRRRGTGTLVDTAEPGALAAAILPYLTDPARPRRPANAPVPRPRGLRAEPLAARLFAALGRDRATLDSGSMAGIRTVARNAIAQGAADIVGKVLTLLLFAVLARQLGERAFGEPRSRSP